MKYLLIATLASWGLTLWVYHWANHGGDDFSRVIPLMISFVVAVILVVSYGGLALWTHRLW